MSTKRNLAVTFLTAGVTAGILATAVGPAAAQANPVGGKGSTFFVSGALNVDGKAQKVYSFGNADDVVLYGDWSGSGEDLPMVRRGNAFFVPNPANPNLTASSFLYGNDGDTVLVGDWDGDGIDTLAVRRGNEYLVKNDFNTGKADAKFFYGDANDKVMVGNWNGVTTPVAVDGTDNSVPADGDFTDLGSPAIPGDIKPADDPGYNAPGGDPDDYTQATDRLPGTGVDNNKDGDFDDLPQAAVTADVPPTPAKGDTLMIQRGNKFFVKNTITSGNADYTFYFGNPGDSILVGNWATAATPDTKDETGKPAESAIGGDQLAVQRGNQFFKSSELENARVDKTNPTTVESLYFGNPGDTVFIASLESAEVDVLGRPVTPAATITGDGFGVRR